MRIIAGRFKGYRLPPPRNKGLRPTTDRVREAIFSILGVSVEGARVLDLFAGSGAFGFESLSRGAEHAVFVDRDRLFCKALSETARALGAAEEIEVINLDALRAVRRLVARSETFGIVFLDPPYGSGLTERVLAIPECAALLDARSTVVVEGSEREPRTDLPGIFEKVLERRYGDTVVAVLRVRVSSPEIHRREGKDVCP
jgi:16S rRNA (guanine966-N2)-methyltransferase